MSSVSRMEVPNLCGGDRFCLHPDILHKVIRPTETVSTGVIQTWSIPAVLCNLPFVDFLQIMIWFSYEGFWLSLVMREWLSLHWQACLWKRLLTVFFMCIFTLLYFQRCHAALMMWSISIFFFFMSNMLDFSVVSFLLLGSRNALVKTVISLQT